MTGKLHSVLSQSLGSLSHWQHHSADISGQTNYGQFKLTLYNDNIIRVRVTRSDEFEDFSYAVIANSQDIGAHVEEHSDHINVHTTRFTTRITKDPVRFTFLTRDGDVINEDDTFGTSWNGEQVTTYKKLQRGERFIGLGEKTGPLDRAGSGYVNWNTDNFGYNAGSDPLYCTTPFYIGVHNNKVYGIFFDNSHKSFFNFGASNNRFASFAADAGEMNYYFIYGDTVAEVIQHYTHLTGRMEMPPLWSIGYQQCRYSYYPDKEVISVAKTFREKAIPADVIVLDIHYMESYKIFSWSHRDFPNPATLMEQLRSLGFHVVVMCDPGIKVEEGYATYEDGLREDVFIKYPDGTNYTGQVWPGWCHFPDYTNPKTRTWWKNQFHDYVNLGIRGFWNDMNEIATWGNMLPENMIMEFEGHKASIRRGRNLYGFQMARSTYEGTKELLKGLRPFNLTRSGYSGIQRYAAVWTGDNVAYDEHMMLGVRMVSSMGLTGIAFAGYDVGGFVGDASTKLFTRWVSIGAFSPFFRGHSMINSRDSEPWSYGEEAEQICRNYIRFRYQLMPYIYSLFYEASINGMPVQRSMAIDYTHDYRIYDGQFQNQYLFGPSLLIAPVESTKEFVKVYLPEGDWYYLYTGMRYHGPAEVIIECPVHKLPVFVKAGSILPMQDAGENSLVKHETLIFHVYAGGTRSSFTYYEDEGETFAYQQGEYITRVLEHDAINHAVTIHKSRGQYNSPRTRLKVVFHNLEGSILQVYVNGEVIPLHKEVNRFFAGLEKFDPIKEPEAAPEENVRTIEIPYSDDEIVIRYVH